MPLNVSCRRGQSEIQPGRGGVWRFEQSGAWDGGGQRWCRAPRAHFCCSSGAKALVLCCERETTRPRSLFIDSTLCLHAARFVRRPPRRGDRAPASTTTWSTLPATGAQASTSTSSWRSGASSSASLVTLWVRLYCACLPAVCRFGARHQPRVRLAERQLASKQGGTLASVPRHNHGTTSWSL
jgi:hypothetical protein